MEFCSLLFRIAACFARSLKLVIGVLCLVFALLTPFGVFGIVDCCCLWFFVAICISILILDHIVLELLFLVRVCFFLVCFVLALLLVDFFEDPGVLVDSLFLVFVVPGTSLMLAVELDGSAESMVLLISSRVFSFLVVGSQLFAFWLCLNRIYVFFLGFFYIPQPFYMPPYELILVFRVLA